MLVDILMSDNNYSSHIRGYVGGALSEICFHGGISDATIAIQTSGPDFVDGLAKVLLHDKNEICRVSAAQILEHLCTHYTKDDECLGKLKKAMTDAMPEVLAEICTYEDETHTEEEVGEDGLDKPEPDIENQHGNGKGEGICSCSSSHLQNNEKKVLGEIIGHGDKPHREKEADRDESTKPNTDIENQCDNVWGKVISSSSSSHPQNNEKKVLGEIIRCRKEPHIGKEVDQDGFAKPKTDIESQRDGTPENNERDKEEKGCLAVTQSIRSTELLSSLLSLCGAVYDTVFIIDLPPHLDASSYLNKPMEVVVKKSDHPTVKNLLLCKAISKMVISMIKHNENMFIKREDLQSLIEALYTAAKNMLDLYSTRFCPASRIDHIGTLASLVKEAKELHAIVPSTSEPPEGRKQAEDEAAKLARESAESKSVDDFSIKRCINVLNALEEVTQAEKAKAFGVFKNVENCEIFLSADPNTALMWLRSEMA